MYIKTSFSSTSSGIGDMISPEMLQKMMKNAYFYITKKIIPLFRSSKVNATMESRY